VLAGRVHLARALDGEGRAHLEDKAVLDGHIADVRRCAGPVDDDSVADDLHDNARVVKIERMGKGGRGGAAAVCAQEKKRQRATAGVGGMEHVPEGA
jgi:hypothetical protein